MPLTSVINDSQLDRTDGAPRHKPIQFIMRPRTIHTRTVRRRTATPTGASVCPSVLSTYCIEGVGSTAPLITSPPRSNLGRARPYLHVGECTLPLRVLAVACTMHNEALRSVTGRYGTLQKITERCVTLQNVTEPFRKISIMPITN